MLISADRLLVFTSFVSLLSNKRLNGLKWTLTRAYFVWFTVCGSMSCAHSSSPFHVKYFCVSLCESMSTKAVRHEQRYLQLSVGMATKSNSSQFFKIFLQYNAHVSWKEMHRAIKPRSFTREEACAHFCVKFCGASLCLFLVLSPSSSVASSNQDIMRAKRGCISTLRAAGFSEQLQGSEMCRKRARQQEQEDRK